MSGRWIGGCILAAACMVLGGCPTQQGGESAGPAVAVIEGNVLGIVTAAGVPQAEVSLTVHVNGVKFTGKAVTSNNGHFVAQVRGPAVVGPGAKVETVDVVVVKRGYQRLEQTLPEYLIHRSGDVITLPDLQLIPEG